MTDFIRGKLPNASNPSRTPSRTSAARKKRAKKSPSGNLFGADKKAGSSSVRKRKSDGGKRGGVRKKARKSKEGGIEGLSFRSLSA
eukprot:1392343-Amorphochlora_amoeboformis.AAC.1